MQHHKICLSAWSLPLFKGIFYREDSIEKDTFSMQIWAKCYVYVTSGVLQSESREDLQQILCTGFIRAS